MLPRLLLLLHFSTRGMTELDSFRGGGGGGSGKFPYAKTFFAPSALLRSSSRRRRRRLLHSFYIDFCRNNKSSANSALTAATIPTLVLFLLLLVSLCSPTPLTQSVITGQLLLILVSCNTAHIRCQKYSPTTVSIRPCLLAGFLRGGGGAESLQTTASLTD